MKISISKTVQVKQFEPVTVTVEEEAPVNSNEEYEELKEKVGACVEDILAREMERYRNTSRH
jgi:hypothetical protein